jgi:hypothetical protein
MRADEVPLVGASVAEQVRRDHVGVPGEGRDNRLPSRAAARDPVHEKQDRKTGVTGLAAADPVTVHGDFRSPHDRLWQCHARKHGPAGHSRSTRPATAGTTSEGGESTPTDAKIVVGRAMKYLAGAVLTRG